MVLTVNLKIGTTCSCVGDPHMKPKKVVCFL